MSRRRIGHSERQTPTTRDQSALFSKKRRLDGEAFTATQKEVAALVSDAAVRVSVLSQDKFVNSASKFSCSDANSSRVVRTSAACESAMTDLSRGSERIIRAASGGGSGTGIMPACRHPKNGDQKVDALWIKQQRSRAAVGGVTQLTRDRLRRAMQFAIRDARAFVVPVDQELIGQLIR